MCLLVPCVGLAVGSCRPAPAGAGEGERAPAVIQPPGIAQSAVRSSVEERQLREEQSKQEAVSLYPELGVAGTAVNREYVRRYRLYQSVNPAFFEEPDWPKRLAEMLAQDLGLDPRR